MIPPGRGTSSLIPSSASNRLSFFVSHFIFFAAPSRIHLAWMHPSCRIRARSGRTPYLKVADGKHFTAKRSRRSHVPEIEKFVIFLGKWQHAFRYRWRYRGNRSFTFFEFEGSVTLELAPRTSCKKDG